MRPPAPAPAAAAGAAARTSPSWHALRAGWAGRLWGEPLPMHKWGKAWNSHADGWRGLPRPLRPRAGRPEARNTKANGSRRNRRGRGPRAKRCCSLPLLSPHTATRPKKNSLGGDWAATQNGPGGGGQGQGGGDHSRGKGRGEKGERKGRLEDGSEWSVESLACLLLFLKNAP